MGDEIVIEIIGTAGSVAVGIISALLAVHNANKKRAVEEAIKDQKLADRLEAIDKQVEEHNNYAKMFLETTQDIAEIKNDIKWLKNDRAK